MYGLKLRLILSLFIFVFILSVGNAIAGVMNTCGDANGGALECVVDDVADDVPNQKDLSMVCLGTGAPLTDINAICVNQTGDGTGNCDDSSIDSQDGCFSPLPVGFHCDSNDDILITWNWDDFDWSGANTGNVCILFDTNANGNSDYALCVVIDDPDDDGFAEFQSQVAYSCDDTGPNNCLGASLLTSVEANKCGTDITNDDPFNPLSVSDPDSKGSCCIDSETTFGEVVEPLKVCTYPSNSLNSAASDCVFSAPPETGCPTPGETDGCPQVGGICAPNVCQEGDPNFCELEPILGCCANDADCNEDGDECTLDECVSPGTVDGCLPEGEVPFNLEDNFCFCSLEENSTDSRCVSTVIVPTMGQWGMLLAAIVLGLFAVIRLRSLKDSELG